MSLQTKTDIETFKDNYLEESVDKSSLSCQSNNLDINESVKTVKSKEENKAGGE